MDCQHNHPFPSSSQILLHLPDHPTSCSLSFHQPHLKKETHQVHFLLANPPGCGACPGVWSEGVTLFKETVPPLSRQPSDPSTSSTRTELLGPPHSRVPGVLTDLSMCRSCECCQNLWVHVCTAPLCLETTFLDIIYHLWLCMPLCTLLPMPWGKGCAVDIPSTLTLIFPANTSRSCGVSYSAQTSVTLQVWAPYRSAVSVLLLRS